MIFKNTKVDVSDNILKNFHIPTLGHVNGDSKHNFIVQSIEEQCRKNQYIYNNELRKEYWFNTKRMKESKRLPNDKQYHYINVMAG